VIAQRERQRQKQEEWKQSYGDSSNKHSTAKPFFLTVATEQSLTEPSLPNQARSEP
jgi:hypothetical protein